MREKKLRIFMCGYSANKGGVETYIDNLCGAMDASEFEIVYNMPRMELDGKVWVRPRTRHNYLKYRSFWRRFYRENRFDVLYYNTCDVVSIDMLKFAKRGGVPVRIIHSHNTGIQRSIGRGMNPLHRRTEQRNRRELDRYATHFLACSEAAGEWMFDGRPFTVIKNGVTLSKYRPDPAARQALRGGLAPEGQPLIGMIGRLAAQKNPLFAVEILSRALKKDGGARAVFIGDGDLRAEVESAVAEAGLGAAVTFTGAVSNVHEWLSAIDCILMPSLFEGLPFVLVEAQAAGLPCVVSSAVSREADLTGLVEFLDLEQPPEVWADAVLTACTKPRPDTRQRLTDAGYSIESTAKTVSDLIAKALKD